MKIALFSAKPYDREFFNAANERFGHEIHYFEPALNADTCPLAVDPDSGEGFETVCIFVNDELNENAVSCLASQGTRLIALRCAGFNNVDLNAAQSHGMTVVRVPAYSPYAVAEHTLALILTLNRKIHRAYNRVREGNFALNGLMGFDLYGRTVGVVGTGAIGERVCHILKGCGCRILAFDPNVNTECQALGVEYVELDRLFRESHIVTLHCPLMPQTKHMINRQSIASMKDGVMLINTSRGGLIDSEAAVEGLKSGKIGSMAMDVYEEEDEMFFEDHSGEVIMDDVFARLLSFPNVIVTGHQAFFTRNALEAIADTTLTNIQQYEAGEALENEVKPKA